MDCYTPYELFLERRNMINKGKYLLKSSCCDDKSCELLQKDLQETRHKCNDLFRSFYKDNLDEKGNILSESICTELRNKQRQVYSDEQKFTKKAGKRIKRKTGKNSKKYKYRRNKTQKRSKKYSTNK